MEREFMRFLVTGGAGFVGSHLAEALLQHGHSVRILDSFVTGSRTNLAYLRAIGRELVPTGANPLEVIVGDIRDRAVVRRCVRDIDVVLHQAALQSVSRSIGAPDSTHDVNVCGTLNVLMACRDAGVQRVVFASSSSIYGDTPTLPKQEIMAPAPHSPYAVSKVAGEYYCQVFQRIYGLPTVCLRYFNVFGPRQNPNSQYSAAVPRFISALLRREPPMINGDGLQTRDFTYVENVVQANLAAAQMPEVSGVLNVGCGRRTSLLALLEMLGRVTGVAVEPRLGPPRPGDIHASTADIRRAEQELGYRPLVGLEDGLERTVDWFRRELRIAPVPTSAVVSELRLEPARS
jgi:UDP-N-acetylglucosamine/UDP-N-acetyl-alpha-D-glucosaminouronate 4-epimerase